MSRPGIVEGARPNRIALLARAFWERLFSAVDKRSAHRLSIVVGLVGIAAGFGYLVWLTRNEWFFLDEWNFLVRRDISLDGLMAPHNGHWSMFPVLEYRLLYSLVGISTYAPYMVLQLVAHAVGVGLVLVLVRRAGLPPVPSVIGAWTLLLLGSGAVHFIWAFQIGWAVPIALFLGCCLLLESNSPTLRKDRLAAALLVVSLPFSAVSITLAAGLIAAVALLSQWRRAVLLGASVGLVFAPWYLLWGRQEPVEASLGWLPPYMARWWVARVESFTGLPAELAGPLLICLLALLARKFADGSLTIAPAAAAGGFFFLPVLMGLARAQNFGIEQAAEWRYNVVGVFMLLVMVAGVFPRGGPVRESLVWSTAVSLLLLGGFAWNVSRLPDEVATNAASRGGVSYTRVVAAYSLVSGGEAYFPEAQPDPIYAVPLTAGHLAVIASDGRFGEVVSVSAAEEGDARVRLQLRVTGASTPTAELGALEGTASSSDDAGCRLIELEGQGVYYSLSFSEGIVLLHAEEDRSVTIYRSESEEPVAGMGLQLNLFAGEMVALEFAAPKTFGDELVSLTGDHGLLKICAGAWIDY